MTINGALGPMHPFQVQLHARHVGFVDLQSRPFKLWSSLDPANRERVDFCPDDEDDPPIPAVYLIIIESIATYYVGQTKNMCQRLRKHLGNNGSPTFTAFMAASSKCGQPGVKTYAEFFFITADYVYGPHPSPARLAQIPRTALHPYDLHNRLAVEGLALIWANGIFRGGPAINSDGMVDDE